MKKVFIVGAGGFGREMLYWTSSHSDCGREWSVEGFIDDNPDALHGFRYDLRVVCGVSDYVPESDHLLLMALGKPSTKKAVSDKLLARGARFMTFVHPSSIVGTNVEIGAGSVICPRCVLTVDAKIGRFVLFNVASGCGHDVRVGDYCSLSGQCDLTGGVSVGEGAMFGAGAKVIPGRKIGAWATVGTGSVVFNHVPDGATVFGNPAKRLV